MTKAPCMDCPERCYLCHAHCDRYASWTQQRSKLKEKIINDLRVDDFLSKQGARRHKMPDSRLRRNHNA